MKRNMYRDIIESIPNDGCLLIFNAPHKRIRIDVRRYGCGMLRAHYFNTAWSNPEEKDAVIRDLYVTWRDQ